MKLFNSALFALLVNLTLATSITAQDIKHRFRFTIKERSDLDRLTRVISIASVVHDTVYAYANEKEWETLHGLGYDATELPRPGGQYGHEMSNSVSGDEAAACSGLSVHLQA